LTISQLDQTIENKEEQKKEPGTEPASKRDDERQLDTLLKGVTCFEKGDKVVLALAQLKKIFSDTAILSNLDMD